MRINLTSQRSELVCPRWVRFHNLSCTKEVPLPSLYVVLESPLCAQTPPPVRRVVDGVWGCFWKEENEGEYSPWMHQTEKKTLPHCSKKAARWLQSNQLGIPCHPPPSSQWRPAKKQKGRRLSYGWGPVVAAPLPAAALKCAGLVWALLPVTCGNSAWSNLWSLHP